MYIKYAIYTIMYNYMARGLHQTLNLPSTTSISDDRGLSHLSFRRWSIYFNSLVIGTDSIQLWQRLTFVLSQADQKLVQVDTLTILAVSESRRWFLL